MKMKTMIATLLGAFLLLTVQTATAADVVQGKCLSFDSTSKIISLEEYDTNSDESNKYGKPTGIMSRFDASNAKIGMTPEPGDILRIAYIIENNTNKAIKVMNVSKQDLMKK